MASDNESVDLSLYAVPSRSIFLVGRTVASLWLSSENDWLELSGVISFPYDQVSSDVTSTHVAAALFLWTATTIHVLDSTLDKFVNV
ncbi:unnamed protein product [Penicillium camemberti]|uniref:Str. FM013 n=1 Tax=Penicillium camemberti (strain FM 013) TaxID=1429867 RepID=A0A0G4PDU1_PENC3|nr:unnamed protein product [Penicillium camemberti]